MNWRIFWYQLVDGVRRLKWHTGPEHECRLLQQTCVACNEEHYLRKPGEFK